MTKESDLLSIRGPSRQIRLHRGKNKLELLRSICPASPHRAIGGIVVGDPVSIAGEVEPHRRNSRKIGRELFCIGIVAQQLSARLPALDKKSLAIAARHGIADIHRPGRQLHRQLGRGAKKTTMFVDGPEVCRAVPACLKNEILSVRRPLAAAFVGSLVPTWKERMKIAAIRGSLPDRAVIGLGIVYREAQNRSVRRPANIARGPTRIQELMWFASIAPRNEYFVAFAINDLLPVRRPRSRVAFKIPQAPRRTAKHRHTPKRAVERSASGRIHQKCGTIRRNIEHIS